MSDWQNKIIGHELVAPDQLLAHPLNFRVHPKHQQDALKGVIAEIGYIKSVARYHAGPAPLSGGHPGRGRFAGSRSLT